MSSAHNILEGIGTAKSTGDHYIVPPAASGTINLCGIDGGLVLGNTASNETWKLPIATDTPFGTVVWVGNKLSGVLTITNTAGTTIDIVDAGEIKGFVLSATSAWKPIGGATSDQYESLLTSETGTGRISVPLTSITKENGTPLGVAGADSGFAQLANKNIVLQIPINATSEVFAASIGVPPDLSIAAETEVVLNVVASKSANGNSLTLDAELYALGDAAGTIDWTVDGYGGNAAAITQSLSVLEFVPSADWLLASLGEEDTVLSLAFVLILGGTNDGDVVYIHDVYWTYRKKLVTS